MRRRLTESNRDLRHQLTVLKKSLQGASVDASMQPFVRSVLAICEWLDGEVERQLRDLDYGLDDTFPDILEATQRCTMLFDLVNTRLAAPITRYSKEDRLALRLLRWMHEGHDATRGKPFAVSDGGFAVYRTPDWAVVYLLPSSRRTTLLYLPLLFHEFGHLLYACRKAELDDLVHEFQSKVARALAPTTVRDRGGVRPDDSMRQAIVSAWYSWAQEIFCDAVGLTIGGACFLRAFSHYFRFRSSHDYYLPREEQIRRRHPVTRLRTKMLLDRAREYGLADPADDVEDAWTLAARVLGLDEDYEGTWVETLFRPLRATLDDMLVEASPNDFRAAGDDSPVQVITEAWARFESGTDDFHEWERIAVERLVQT
jgi:hypothetical protein